ALRAHGLDLDTTRDLVATHHVDPEPETDETQSDEATGYDEDREALKAIGIDLDRVREAVRANLGADLAEGWADRPDRERRRGRGPRPCGRGGPRPPRGAPEPPRTPPRAPPRATGPRPAWSPQPARGPALLARDARRAPRRPPFDAARPARGGGPRRRTTRAR